MKENGESSLGGKVDEKTTLDFGNHFYACSCRVLLNNHT